MIINPEDIPDKTSSNYSEKFKALVGERSKKRLGNAAGIKDFGLNLIKLAPESCSTLKHWHIKQDELIYVLEGEITLVTNQGNKL